MTQALASAGQPDAPCLMYATVPSLNEAHAVGSALVTAGLAAQKSSSPRSSRREGRGTAKRGRAPDVDPREGQPLARSPSLPMTAVEA